MRSQLFSSWCFLFLLLCLHVIFAQEVEDERDFDYLEGSNKGPKHWGEIKEEWVKCNHGKLQSPIDMSNKRVEVIPKLGVLKRNYKPGNATIINRGHDISIQWLGEGNAGSIRINDIDYFLTQCHWHSPSEHTIDGKKFALELHMVHVSYDPGVQYKIAVVGLFYKIGQHDAFLAKLANNLSTMIDKKEERIMGMIDPRKIKLRGHNYYRYMGSLTVPPCTEGVIWTINKSVKTVSSEQVKLLREAVHDYAETNKRPLQPLNRRKVKFFGRSLPQLMDMSPH